VFYADVIFIFDRGNKKSLKNIQMLLEKYGYASRQRVNNEKKAISI